MADLAIPTTQKVAAITTFSDPPILSVLTDYPVPDPATLLPSQALVRITHSGVCHSDLHIAAGHWPAAPPPLVGGHEGVGLVVAFSPGAELSDGSIKIGARVGVKWLIDACGRCEVCRRGSDPLCPFRKLSGLTVDGTFCEYMVAWIDHLIPIPDSVSSQDAAPILCAGLTVYSALKRANLAVGDWVVVPGAGGGLGHLAIQYALAIGLRVVAIDSGAEKKSLCLALGADRWIDFKETSNVPDAVISICDGLGAHAALVTSPSTASYYDALAYLRPLGTLMALGAPIAFTFNVSLDLLVVKGLHIVGSILGNRQDAHEALDLVARGKVKSHQIPCKLEDINTVFREMETGTSVGRAVIQMEN